MTARFDTLGSCLRHGFDTLIDVRSPSEFDEDHIPGAISLPVLTDAERAEVGTIYKQQSPFRARKIGASLVFANAARHLSGPLAHRSGDWRPLVYCWRGGQRSGSFAWMLGEVGWRAGTIPGGYRTYRRLVKSRLYDGPLGIGVIQLGGYTGTAKTALLPLLQERGIQVLDLEGMAAHRGSLLGARPGGQPSQKRFESRLAMALEGVDPERPLVVEAESSRIGRILLPPALWDAMRAAPSIEIAAPLDERARYLAAAYEDILADGAGLMDKLGPLRALRGQALIAHWQRLVEAGDRRALCRSLAQDHYDPAYRRAAGSGCLARIETERLDAQGLDALADRVAAAVQASVS